MVWSLLTDPGRRARGAARRLARRAGARPSSGLAPRVHSGSPFADAVVGGPRAARSGAGTRRPEEVPMLRSLVLRLAPMMLMVLGGPAAHATPKPPARKVAAAPVRAAA